MPTNSSPHFQFHHQSRRCRQDPEPDGCNRMSPDQFSTRLVSSPPGQERVRHFLTYHCSQAARPYLKNPATAWQYLGVPTDDRPRNTKAAGPVERYQTPNTDVLSHRNSKPVPAGVNVPPGASSPNERRHSEGTAPWYSGLPIYIPTQAPT